MRSIAERLLLITSLAVLTLVLLAPASQAQTGFSLAPKIGTRGAGLDVNYEILTRVQLRGTFQGGSLDTEQEENGIDYDIEADLLSAGLGVDVFPAIGGFFVSGGLLYNGNEFTVDSTPTEMIQIGDTMFSPTEVGRLDGSIEFDDIAPYLSLGVGNPHTGLKVGFRFEVGAMFQGDSRVDLTASNDDITPGLSEALELERRELEDDASDLEVWPILSFALTVRL